MRKKDGRNMMKILKVNLFRNDQAGVARKFFVSWFPKINSFSFLASRKIRFPFPFLCLKERKANAKQMNAKIKKTGNENDF